jgi:hypothetical protein
MEYPMAEFCKTETVLAEREKALLAALERAQETRQAWVAKCHEIAGALQELRFLKRRLTDAQSEPQAATEPPAPNLSLVPKPGEATESPMA